MLDDSHLLSRRTHNQRLTLSATVYMAIAADSYSQLRLLTSYAHNTRVAVPYQSPPSPAS